MNNGSWLPEEEEEEELKGLSDNFFDDLINHLDLETTANDDEGDWDAKFENLVPPPMDVLTSLSSEFTHGKGRRGAVQRKPTLKQSSSSEVSSTIDSSLPDVKVSTLFQSSNAVSVLENNAANGSVSFQNPNRAFPVKGTRSKLRKRPTTPTFRSLQSFASEMVQQFAPDDSAAKKKRQRQKNKNSVLSEDSPEPFNSDGTVRICTHCETTKTPQWREGPCGPKTLCNACGVRFRSGRLVPEYRPSSSPSFIPSVHSNSHRKIIEMRRKVTDLKPG